MPSAIPVHPHSNLMFILSRLSDDIRVLPSELSKPPLQSVTEVIQERYFDRVIPQLGLVVTLYDVLSIEGGFIHPNDGAAYFKVEFRVVVFRPFVGEVITGKLRACGKEGLYISLGEFFDDVFVPEHALQEPSFFNDVEKLWLWKFDGKGVQQMAVTRVLSAFCPMVHLMYQA
jgi:DNA-directed RNA polymerase subunit E'/Rpb7